MKVLLASAEVHPYSKTGGLADMVGALAKALARAGLRVGLVTPLYQGILERFPGMQASDGQIDLPLGTRRVRADVFKHEWESGLTIYFIHQPEFFHRAGLYQEQGEDYPDNAERFVFLSKCVVHLARSLPWEPELVHVHDWQVALTPLLIKDEKERAEFARRNPERRGLHGMENNRQSVSGPSLYAPQFSWKSGGEILAATGNGPAAGGGHSSVRQHQPPRGPERESYPPRSFGGNARRENAVRAARQRLADAGKGLPKPLPAVSRPGGRKNC